MKLSQSLLSADVVGSNLNFQFSSIMFQVAKSVSTGNGLSACPIFRKSYNNSPTGASNIKEREVVRNLVA